MFRSGGEDSSPASPLCSRLLVNTAFKLYLRAIVCLCLFRARAFGMVVSNITCRGTWKTITFHCNFQAL